MNDRWYTNLCSGTWVFPFSIRLRLWFGLWFGWPFAIFAKTKCSICSYQLNLQVNLTPGLVGDRGIHQVSSILFFM